MRRFGAVVLAAGLAFGMVACGDDGGDDDVSLDDVSDAGSGSGSGSSTDDTEPGDGGGGDDPVDSGEFDLGSEECQDLIGALTGIGGIFAGQGEEAELDFGQFADAFEEIDAPEIEDDLQVLADGYRQVDEALGDLDLSDPSTFTSPEFAEVAEELGTEEFTEASDRVSDFFNEVCSDG